MTGFLEPDRQLREVFVHTWIGAGLVWSLAIGWALRHAAPTAAVIGFLVSIPLISLLVACDMTYRVLPRRLSHATIVLVAPLLIAGSGPSNLGRWGSAVGALGMLVMTLIIDAMSGGVLGRGDIHFAPLIGLIVGWFEPRQVITVWVVVALIAAIVSLSRKAHDRLVPYGPLLAIGATVAIIVGS